MLLRRQTAQQRLEPDFGAEKMSELIQIQTTSYNQQSDTSAIGAKSHLILVQPQNFGLLEGFVNGLLSLANYVSTHSPSTSVELLDLSYVRDDSLDDEIWDALPQEDVRLFVGITTTTASYQSALQIAHKFKQLSEKKAGRKCVIILGGHHAGPQDDIILRRHRDIVDYIVRGEGEVALTQLIQSQLQSDTVPNLSFVNSATGELQRTQTAPLLDERELDQIPVSFNGEGIRSTMGKFDHVTYVSARGCPLKCAFCAVSEPGKAIRAKSVGEVIKDLKYLVEDRGFRRIAIEDNFFAQSPRRTKELCRAIAAYRDDCRQQLGITFNWDCQTRVESMKDEEIVREMERAGCDAVYLGVEALTEEQLRYLNKATNPERYLKAMEQVVERLLRSNIAPYINVQLGLPETDAYNNPVETKHTRRATVLYLKALGHLAKSYRKKITVFPMLHVVYPGTTHFTQWVNKGVLTEDCFEKFTEWECKETPILKWLGEHFAHGTGGIPIGILDEKKLKQGDYVISASAVAGVMTYLKEMSEASDGLEIFAYGKYLVDVPAVREEAHLKEVA